MIRYLHVNAAGYVEAETILAPPRRVLPDCTIVEREEPLPPNTFGGNYAFHLARGRWEQIAPPSERVVTRADLTSDPRWQALKNATGAEIDQWLTNNVTDLASARRVLGMLLRAVRVLASDGRFDG